MTLRHLPSRRVSITAAAVAGVGTIVGLFAIYWQTIVTWALIAVVLRFGWRRLVGPSRRHGSLIRRLAEAGAVVAGLLGLRKVSHAAGELHLQRTEAARIRDERAAELHAARIETERARAEELRSRAGYRRRTRHEQEAAEKRAWIQGFAEGEHSR